MGELPIDLHYSICLVVAVAWTTLFSMTIKQPVRGFRNIGILASYVLLVVMLFRLPIISALVTWIIFGICGGLMYFVYDLFSWARTKEASAEPRGPRVAVLLHGLVGWPVMIPEAIEYLLADLGVLRTTSVEPRQSDPPAA